MSDVSYNRENTILAWQKFIETGEIPPGHVRKSVADSWLRCRELGVDPFGTSFPHRSKSTLQAMQERYRELAAYATPCIHLLMTILTDGGLTLTSPDLFTYYMLSSYEANPVSYGIYLDEASCGNTAISIAALERRPMFLHKYEKYRLVDQNVSSAAAPIFVGGELQGFISANGISGMAPRYIYELTCRAAEIIGLLASEKPGAEETLRLCSQLIELSHRPTLLIGGDGVVAAANGDSLRFLPLRRPDGKGVHISEIAAGRDDLACFMLGEESAPERSRCNLRTIYGGCFNFLCLKKGGIRFPSGAAYTAVTLELSTPGRQVLASSGAARALPARPEREDKVEYLGRSLAWARVDNVIKKVSRFPSNVFIQGESGTGKEVVARTIHNLSGRRGSFVAINCAGIPDGLLQSELFGYEKGAFTGANREGSMGKFEYADHGTVFLDEIGDMPMSMQVSLLRFIQERTVQRVGSNKPRSVDVRIIAATNKDIEQMLKEKTFRSDLYYRLNIIGLTLPPLRERKEDIPLLAQHFIQLLSQQYGLAAPKVDDDVFDILCKYDWPGNVRELRNAMEKMLIMSGNRRISADTLYAYVFDYDEINSAAPGAASEKDTIYRLLRQYGGNVTRTAAELGMARDTLYRRMRKYGIDVPRG